MDIKGTAAQCISVPILTEQEIIDEMESALDAGQFIVYYQPQYNHASGLLVGAEALARWSHPTKGLVSPALFIPTFEKTDFISKFDLYIFEQVCAFLRCCLDKNVPIVSISINLTRHDIFLPGFIDELEVIRSRYDVPSKYLRIELTESSALGNSEQINKALKKLHSFGYIIEMDDFGSGYSSLNILKDIDFDVVKIDMRFMEKSPGQSKRGGIILSSVVRMLNWLQLPAIAEGVETCEQADFLQSVGCNNIHGYLYSRPLPEKEYRSLLSGSHLGDPTLGLKLIDTMDAVNFWSSDSLETLIFSNYVGAAAIFEYKDGKTELLRINQKYLHELGMNMTEKEIIHSDILASIDDTGRGLYLAMLEKAAQTADEAECETWRSISSSCCGDEKICVRTSVRMIGKGEQTQIFYAMIRNITAEKTRYDSILDSERRFKMASEQANIYYWEYTVATREMRPCFRCMRDLGLPALLKNYPDSAIEMGVFPP